MQSLHTHHNNLLSLLCAIGLIQMEDCRIVPIPDDGGSRTNGKIPSLQTPYTAALPSSTIGIVPEKLSLSVADLVPEIVHRSLGSRQPLPKLPYSLRTRKLAITIAWVLLLLDACILPLLLFYVLKYVAKLDDTRNLGITNSIFGFFSLFQFCFRMFRLLQTSSYYRPIGATSRFCFDFYQIQFCLGFVIITILISLATSVTPPLLRVLAMTPTVLLGQCGPLFVLSCYGYRKGWKAPFRISSMAKGERAPVALFTIIEDIVAVDGGAGRGYRATLKARYEASERFREMLWQLTFIWGISSTLAAGVTSAVVWTVPEYVAYGFGWSFPFLWAAVMAVWTFDWVQKKLKQEMEWWEEGTNE